MPESNNSTSHVADKSAAAEVDRATAQRFLRKGHWVAFHKDLKSYLDWDEAGFLSHLMDLDQQFHNEDGDEAQTGGWFYHSAAQIQQEVYINEKQTQRLVDKLKARKLVRVEVRGSPPKRHFWVDYARIWKLAREGRESFLRQKLLPERRSKSLETDSSVSQFNADCILSPADRSIFLPADIQREDSSKKTLSRFAPSSLRSEVARNSTREGTSSQQQDTEQPRETARVAALPSPGHGGRTTSAKKHPRQRGRLAALDSPSETQEHPRLAKREALAEGNSGRAAPVHSARAFAKRIHTTVVTKMHAYQSYSASKWEEHVHRLLNKLGGDAARLDRALTWWELHCADQFTPRIRSASVFLRKFPALEAAMRRSQDLPAEVVVIGSAAGELASTLRSTLHWPKGSESQLEDCVQRSYDAYSAIHSTLKRVVSESTSKRLASTASHLIASLGSAKAVTASWMRRQNEQVQDWESWSGKLQAISLESKRFEKWMREEVERFCGKASRWDELKQEMEKFRDE
jgi:hypothetical protein